MTTTLLPETDADIDAGADETETAPAATVTCIICDGDGTVCERCTRPKQRCECEGGCDRTVVCEDCNGDGTKPAGEYGSPVEGEADLRDDEPAPAADEPQIADPVAGLTALSIDTETKKAARLRSEKNQAIVELAASIDQQQKVVADRALAMAKSEIAVKQLKKAFKGAVEDLEELEGRFRTACQPMPLFDQATTDPKPSESNPEGLDGTTKVSPTNPEGSTNDAWRSTCIDALQAHDLSEKIVAKLRDKSIETLGDLADFQARHGEFWAKEIKGLGPQKAAKVADAQAAFWLAHPEFCGNSGPA